MTIDLPGAIFIHELFSEPLIRTPTAPAGCAFIRPAEATRQRPRRAFAGAFCFLESGAQLWRDVMQSAGVSFDRVAGAYDVICADAVKKERGFVNALPRLAATVRIEGGNIVVQPIFTGVPPGRLVCLTMNDDPAIPQVTALRREKNGTFTWRTAQHTGPVFRYLLGWQTAGTRLPVFEPWAEAVPTKK